MSDVVTRLICESSEYSAGIKRAKASISEFNAAQAQAKEVLSGAAAMVAKFAGAIGLAQGATEAFTQVIRGSQTTSDEFDQVMRACQSSVNEFFSALSTGDFSVFATGLDNIISKAREAQMALDQLGNTTISYGYFTAKNNADFQEQLAILKDANATEEQRAAANAKIKEILGNQKGITEQLQLKSQEAISKLVVEGNNLDASQIQKETIDKVLMVDVSAAGEMQKTQWSAQYDEYRKKVAEITAKNTKTETVGMGYNVHTVQTVDTDAIKKELAPINDQYLEAIAYNEILVKKNDDWLKELVSIQQAADNADRSYNSMVKTANRAQKGASGGGTTRSTTVPAKTEEQKVQEEVIVNTLIQYDSEIGRKMLEHIAGKEFEVQPIVVPIEEEVEDDGVVDALLTKRAEETEAYKKQLDNTASAAETMGKMFGSAASAMSAMGENDAAKVFSIAENIAELIAQYSSIAIAAGVAQGAKMPFPYNLAAMGAVVSTVTGIISSLNYAEGGIVPGSNFQDGIVARVSSGEMFINQHDQKQLYNEIHSGSSVSGNQSRRAIVTGEQIVLAVNNWGRRVGKGELL